MDAMEQREQDAELGIGLDGPYFDAADNDQRIRELCDKLLAGLGLERRSPLAEKARAIIAEHELRRAIPFAVTQPCYLCGNPVRRDDLCDDHRGMATRDQIRHGRRSA